MAKSRPDAAATGGGEQSIETLRERFAKLEKERTRAETNRENAQRALEDLRKRARKEYQTDDLGQLQKKLQEKKAENERLRSEYQKHLDSIEAKLASVEKNYADASNG